jgi:hypothetical protein
MHRPERHWLWRPLVIGISREGTKSRGKERTTDGRRFSQKERGGRVSHVGTEDIKRDGSGLGA